MKRKNIILITSILISLLLLGGCSKGPAISLKNESIEANKNTKLLDLITIENGEEYTVEALENDIDIGKCGEYTVHYIIKKDNKKTDEQELTFKVVDTTNPTIKCDETIKVVASDKKFNINKYATITDNSSDKLTITLDGDYDTTKSDSYYVTITAKDSSDNQAMKNITMEVMGEDEEEIYHTSYLEKEKAVMGYWVNKKNNRLIVVKDDGNGSSVQLKLVVSLLNSGPSGSDAGGQISSISEIGENKYKVTYKDYETNNKETLTFTINNDNKMTISSKYKTINGTYEKWSEQKINEYWSK
ncbi:hypothetical protein [Anaerofustis stercorihominis]|uniref:hypothetical protein n=1 Tax=Anaerofustis stercorihominis TaxID=214853 RepID=UPI00214BF927|nr:hypothetical protein [Anaerofustis stercorihominis]MCR2032458.1 hypothetical protein [Anaerofustis stercorihominis]